MDDAFLDRLVGTWNLSGIMRGNVPLNHSVRVEWVLQHQFLQVRTRDKLLPPDHPKGYAAECFIGFNAEADRYVMFLLDTFGAGFAETVGLGRREGEALEFTFAYPRGSMIQRLTHDPQRNAWEIRIIQISATGEEKPFAEKLLVRDPAG